MKNVLCLVVVLLLLVWSAPAKALTVGSSLYTDDFSTDQYLTDAYSIGSTVVREVTNEDLEMYAPETTGITVYEITRTDFATQGVVQFDCSELYSGNGSWVTFGVGSTAGGIAYNNMTNYFRIGNGGSLIRKSLPAGQATTYFGIRGHNSGHADMDNLAISDDSSHYNAGVSQPLAVGNNTWAADFTDDSYLTDTYALNGAAHKNPFWKPATGTIDLLDNRDAITYRFDGGTNTITGGSIGLELHDYASGDGSWIIVDIDDLAGNNLFRRNMTCLNLNIPTNNWTGTINLAAVTDYLADPREAGVIGLTGFDVKVWTNQTTGGHRQLDALSINVDTIPEPATMILLGIGSLALLRRRRA